jgi:TRAP-type C4-dicarboxylate transport system substrate-binding protein
MKLPSLIIIAALAAASAGTPAQAQEHTLRFGKCRAHPAIPLHWARQKFAEILAAKSGGRIKVQELGGGSNRRAVNSSR